MAEHLRQRIAGHWMHSREEDDDDRIVFRPHDYAFPPARGRSGFTLTEEGAVRTASPGPDDRLLKTEGSWGIDGDQLTIDCLALSGVFRVESAQRDKLVLIRLSKDRIHGEKGLKEESS